MAHDRMQNDDLDRNMGRAGQEDDFGGQQGRQQTPGRNPQDQQTGQKGAGQKNNQSGFGNEEEDQFGTGGGYGGSQNPGQGQNK